LAGRPADTLLPNSTKGYLSAPNVDQLVTQFDRSQLGQLANDPLMKPFVEQLKRQFRQQGLKQLEQLGLTWEELEGVPSGEAALATIQVSVDEAAVALVVDATGKTEQAEAVLGKIADRMAHNGAKRLTRSAGDPIIAYQLPGEPDGKAPPVAAYFLQQGMLVASDNLAVLERMLQGCTSERPDSLASVPAYHEIMQRTGAAAGGMKPDLRWFIEPFGYAETLRAALPLREKRKGPDLVKIFKNQGFTAIQGVGGCINFATGKYEVLHRTLVYAPLMAGHDSQSKDKYTLAARMLNFPSGGDLLPQAWVPRNISTYITFNWDMRYAFTVADTLVDEMVGEKGVFHDVLDSLRDDPEGPKVDIAKNLVPYLGERATIISDCEVPVGPRSERKVLAAEVTNEQAVGDTIRRLMEADKSAHRRDFEGFVIWELVDAESEVPVLEIETPGGAVNHSESNLPPHRSREERFLSTTAVCVAQGHVFLASHIDLLKRVLLQTRQPDRLVTADDFRSVANQAAALGIGPMCLRGFSRTDEDFRPTYELIRTGQMPQSESMLGKLLNSLWGEGKEGAVRKQRIDGRDLPEFESVRRYLGPAGTFVSSVDDGWLWVGFMLSKAPIVAADVKADAGRKATGGNAALVR
jgi:hypothetical protein